MFLTCLRLETGSSTHYIWSFAMHTISSSNLLLPPWCTSAPFYSKRARYSVDLSDTSMGYVLKKSIFFRDETKKVVLTCLRLETSCNFYQFWSFTMHSKSSSNFFLRPWLPAAPFYSKGARYCVHLSHSSRRNFSKRSIFSTVRPKKWFQPVYA